MRRQPKMEKVVRQHNAGTVVIDTNQIVIASPGIGQNFTIQQHDRDLRFLKGAQYTAVDLLTLRREFQRREKHPRYFSRDEPLAQLPCLFVL